MIHKVLNTLRTVRPCLVPKRNVSLLMKICAQRKAGRRKQARDASPLSFLLHIVPCTSPPVTSVSLTFRVRVFAQNEAPEEETGTVPLLSWSVEWNARNTKMTTRVTEGRPRFSRLSASPLDAQARVHSPRNLKKKRDCSQTRHLTINGWGCLDQTKKIVMCQLAISYSLRYSLLLLLRYLLWG